MSARCFLVAASLSLAALLGPCAVTAVATTSEGATDSEIFWVSEPVAPGETAVVAFASATVHAANATSAATPALFGRQGQGDWCAPRPTPPTDRTQPPQPP